MSMSQQRESDTDNSIQNTAKTTGTGSLKKEISPISCSKWFHVVYVSYHFQINFTRISSLVLFLPLLMDFGFGSMDGTILASSLKNGSLFYESSIVAVCLVVPLVIDIAIDYFFQIFHKKSKHKTSSKKKKEIIVRDFTNPELVNMLLGFLVVPLVAFFPRCVLSP